MENEQKPDWITDRQWAANPNVYHWEQNRKIGEYQELTKNKPPLTHQEIVAQARRNRILRGEDPAVYDEMQLENAIVLLEDMLGTLGFPKDNIQTTAKGLINIALNNRKKKNQDIYSGPFSVPEITAAAKEYNMQADKLGLLKEIEK